MNIYFSRIAGNEWYATTSAGAHFGRVFPSSAGEEWLMETKKGPGEPEPFKDFYAAMTALVDSAENGGLEVEPDTP